MTVTLSSDLREFGVVVDTQVVSWLVFARTRAKVAREMQALYAPCLAGKTMVLAVQTRAELRVIALSKQDPVARQRVIDRIGSFPTLPVTAEVEAEYAALKIETRGTHLGNKEHDSDRWIAATALAYDLPLVSHDKLFDDVPRLARLRP